MLMFLVRHAQSTWNTSKKIQGQRDPQLSAYGKKEAALLARRFKGLAFDAVYSSPLKRAYQTAEIVAGRKATIVREEGLKEICLGEWEGKTLRSIRKEYGEMFDRWVVRPTRIRVPGGEEFRGFVRRVKKTIRAIEATPEASNVLVVCHGGVISTYATVVLNLPPDDVWCLTVRNASLTIVEVGIELHKLITFNDISHLMSMKGLQTAEVTHVD
jgi:broad specificity phosphatase PhoE